jgi:hypothetical protein
MLRFTRVFGVAALIALCLVGLIVQTVNAATITNLTVTCRRTTIEGSIEVRARFVRVQVTPADNLNHTLDTQVVRVRADGTYSAALRYPRQPDGTLLIISAGEWDGRQYVRPATLTSQHCGQFVPTPVPSGTFIPTVPPYTPFPTPFTPEPSPTFAPPPINYLNVTCTDAQIGGWTQLAANYMRVTASRADDLSVTLAEQVVAVEPYAGAWYNAQLTYPQQPEGTLIVFSVGEWDGSQYLRPATIVSQNCTTFVPTFVPTPLPTSVP